MQISVVAESLKIGADISGDALETSRANAELNGLAARYRTIESNWFSDISGQFDIIVSNPPYISSDVVLELDREVREHDPLLALTEIHAACPTRGTRDAIGRPSSPAAALGRPLA